jgi:hypothetical protein
VTVFKHPSFIPVGMVFPSLLLAGCGGPNLPPVKGPEEQSAARAAFEQRLEALENGNQDKVWDGLSARSQYRIQQNAGEGAAQQREPSPGEKAKAIAKLREIVGRKPKIKDVRGTRSSVEVEFEYADGKSRDLEMVFEGGAWKLNLFSS